MVKLSKSEMRIKHSIIKIHVLYLTEKETQTEKHKLFKAFTDYISALVLFKFFLVITLLIYITCPFFSACSTKNSFRL